MKVLVTGYNGFVGKHLCNRLEKQYNIQLIKPEHKKGWDLLDVVRVNTMFYCYSPDIVIHLAAKVGGIQANARSPGDFIYENMLMGINVIEACRRHNTKKLIMLGTVCSYPRLTPVPFKEYNLWDGYPESTNAPYGIAKRALMQMVMSYRQQYGFNGINLIPTNMYGECFDSNTDVLTTKGIKNIKNVKTRDLVYTLNPATHEVETSKVIDTQKQSTDEWVVFKGKSINFRVTPNHKIYYSTGTNFQKKTAEFFKKRAGKIYGQAKLALHNPIKEEKAQQIFTLERYIDKDHIIYKENNTVRDYKHSRSKRIPYIYDINDFAEFLGWYISEGSYGDQDNKCNHHGQLSIAQSYDNNQDNCEQIKQLLTRMNVPFGYDEHRFYFTSRLFKNYIHSQIGTSFENKKIPEHIFKVFGYKQLLILFNTLMKGDGDKDFHRYTTSSFRLKNDFIHLAFLLGYKVTCSKDKSVWRIFLRPKQLNPTIKYKNISIEQTSNEPCYCITTDKNNIIYAGKADNLNWIGQCDNFNPGTSHVIPAIITKVHNAKLNKHPSVTLWGSGTATREFLYVEDCVDAIILAMDKLDTSEPINIGTGIETRILDLAQMICDIMEYKGKILLDNTKPDGQPRRCLDVNKAEKLMGFKAKTKLYEGLVKTIGWFNERYNF